MISIAFIGSCVEPEEIVAFPAASIAGNKYQLGLLSAFDDGVFDIHQLIFPTFSVFPRGRKVFVTKTVLKKKKNRIICGYINIPFVKQVSCSFSLFRNLLLWNRKCKYEQKCIVMYNVYSYRDIALRLFCKITGIPRILAIADVTEKGYGFWKDYECSYEKRHIKYYDGIIPITDHIHNDYAPQLPYFRIEGGIPEKINAREQNEPITRTKKTIVYTGSLNQYSSIELLLEAFSKINDQNLRLIVAGDGERENSVIDAMKLDTRISFLGKITNGEAIQLQHEADVLVCPRIPDDFVTKYTFPSKIMEYLATGNKVVAFHLQGIPQEYDAFLIYPESISAEALARAIVTIIDDDNNTRNRQIDFINQKQWVCYSNGITELLYIVMNSNGKGRTHD